MSNEGALFDSSYESAIRELAEAQKRIAELEAENANLLQLVRDIKEDECARFDLGLKKSIRERIQKALGEAL